MELYTLHFDGSCGPKTKGTVAAYGYLLEKEGLTMESGSGIIGTGNKMTNNLAEFTALAEGLISFIKYTKGTDTYQALNVYGDSKLVINMMNGKYRPDKEKRYYPGYELALHALKELRNKGIRVTFDHIPRTQNTRCDELSKEHNG